MGHQFSSQLTATLNLSLIYFKITCTLAILLEHLHKKFEINQAKIKDGCQSGRNVATHNSKWDLPLKTRKKCFPKKSIARAFGVCFCYGKNNANKPNITLAIL